ADVAAIRFDVGRSFGAKNGRIGLDDVEIVRRFEAPAAILEMTHSTSGTTVSWPAAVGALSYNVYRGTIPPEGLSSRGPGTAVYDHVCLEPHDVNGDGHRRTIDAEVFPEGRIGFYYLVAAVRAGGEDSLGLATIDLDPETPGDQIERPGGTPCP
ncbi:MAG: hypothetical protein R3344_03890, partial [Acidobacteriota bacterium]|nr:hypothetical protein [Acidobacteriota bacterium]